MKFLILLGGFLFFCYLITKPVRNIFDAITGDPHSQTRRQHYRQSQQPRQDTTTHHKQPKDNIVNPNEGEYVDFEEVK